MPIPIMTAAPGVGGSYQYNPETGRMELIDFTDDPHQSRPPGFDKVAIETPPVIDEVATETPPVIDEVAIETPVDPVIPASIDNPVQE